MPPFPATSDRFVEQDQALADKHLDPSAIASRLQATYQRFSLYGMSGNHR